MPYVNVKIAGTATTEQKERVMAGITQVLVDVLDKKPEKVYVVIDEVSLDNWGSNGESLSTRRARQEG